MARDAYARNEGATEASYRIGHLLGEWATNTAIVCGVSGILHSSLQVLGLTLLAGIAPTLPIIVAALVLPAWHLFRPTKRMCWDMSLPVGFEVWPFGKNPLAGSNDPVSIKPLGAGLFYGFRDGLLNASFNQPLSGIRRFVHAQEDRPRPKAVPS